MVSDRIEEQVSNAPEGQVHTYELLLIFTPEMGEEDLEARLDRIGKMITEKGGTIASVDKWGKRKLAYPIKQAMEGNYVLVNCSFDPALCQQLEASLRISEDILRHLLINVELS